VRIIISTTLGALIFLSGCVNNTNIKPKEHIKTVVKETKTIEKKYFLITDNETRHAVAILIKNNNKLNAEIEKLKKNTSKQKTVLKHKKPLLKKPNIVKNVLGKYMVKTFAVNVREYPTTINSKIISCLNKGDVVEIIENKGEWGKINDKSWVWIPAFEKLKRK